MVTFDKLLEMLADEKVFSFPREKMEEIYGGRIKQKPWKVLNADPNTFYDGSYFSIENANGKSLVYQQETTYKCTCPNSLDFFSMNQHLYYKLLCNSFNLYFKGLSLRALTILSSL